MNKNFSKYLIQSPDPVLRFWIQLYHKRGRNEIFVATKEELIVLFGMDEERLKLMLFNTDVLRAISVIEEFGLYTINFKGPDKKNKKKEVLAPASNDEKLSTEISNVNQNFLDISAVETTGQNNEYRFDEDTKRCLIGDYIEWMKNRQIVSAMLAGRFLEKEKTIAHIIKPIDVKFFRLLAMALYKSGCKTKGQIVRSLRKIYDHWELFPPHIQNFILPQQIYSNYTAIVDFMMTKGRQTTKNEKREHQFNKKISEAGERDYSHLVRSGKGDN